MPSPRPTAAPAIRRPIRRPPTPASYYEEEDDAPPVRSLGSGRDDGGRGPVRRTALAADDPDDRPVRRTRRDDDDEPDMSGLIATGWGGAKKIKSEMPSDFARPFKLTADPVLFKFLQDGPFASFKQHWVEWLPPRSKLGYVCLGEDCPLCDLGDKPAAKFCFNVLDFTDPKHPQNAVLEVRITASNLIENYAKQERTSPLDRADLYFSIQKTGDGAKGRVQTNINPVKARDIPEDWGFRPLTDEALEDYEAKCFTMKETVSISPRSVLEQVAASYKD